MTGSAEGMALSVGEPRQIIPIAFPDRETEERMRAVLQDAGGKDLSVRIEPAEQPDVEGNTMGAALRSVWVNVRVGAGDTVLPAISVHFPTAEEAALFRRRLVAAGLLAGTIAVASAGAIGLANMPTTSSVVTPAAQTQVYERPAGHGFLQNANIDDEAATAPAIAPSVTTSPTVGIDPVTGKPERSGLLKGADIGSAPAATQSGAGGYVGERPVGTGPLEGGPEK
jgi:hypothetical protein